MTIDGTRKLRKLKDTERSITAPALSYLLHPCSRSLTDNGKRKKIRLPWPQRGVPFSVRAQPVPLSASHIVT